MSDSSAEMDKPKFLIIGHLIELRLHTETTGPTMLVYNLRLSVQKNGRNSENVNLVFRNVSGLKLNLAGMCAPILIKLEIWGVSGHQLEAKKFHIVDEGECPELLL